MADSEADPIDQDALAAYLEGAIDGFAGLEKIVKFQSGQSNPTYRLDAESGTYVLRAKPPGKLLKSAHQVDREFRVMAALAGSDVPVPAMLHLAGDEESPIGRAFFVMEHVDGRIFWDPALPEAEDPAERAAIFDAMNGTLAAIHSVDLERAGLADFGRPGNYFYRQLSRWSEQWRQSKIDDIPEMDRLIDWLEDNLPADDGVTTLVHGDYRLDNLIFARDRPEILAVLDWELSTLGHPLADLAYQCMQWRLPNRGTFKGLGGVDRAERGIPSEADYVARYCERRGLDGVDDWTFYLAFSFFRLAAILQGVYKRYADGNASNPEKAQVYGRNVPVLAKLALEAIEPA
ncbi:phosphotransferase family protein [Jiella avicenniae]|uniref:Phosphotransferase family protein n=1 Tax=Jiella avicenniae TaxID=2907202 RepID=A0A9X1P1H7_9HYPH|nr:phosphotransferase family protein [Jiella avicenniae]MCE7027618.1 phosphotransferase family protein [Jiella avicenniae]MCE7028660.1 phosphotransferase family protein [Jiella avicenniae]